MSEDIRSNSPKKEFVFALGGVALFLSIVLLIGISAFLRPAGEHITVRTPEEIAAAEEAEASAAAAEKEAAAATAEAEAAAEPAAEATAPADDATVTPAEDTGDAVVAAESGTATADGTVDQAAVAEIDTPVEKAAGEDSADKAVTPAQ